MDILIFISDTMAILESAAVSIIGGADGPTSIFIAGKVGNTPQLIFCFFIILAGIGIGAYLRKKK